MVLRLEWLFYRYVLFPVKNNDNNLFKGGRIIDPFNERDEIGDIYYHGRKLFQKIKQKNTKYYDATGLIIFPGLIDLRCHINNVNDGNCENIYSVSKAAKAGGYYSCLNA